MKTFSKLKIDEITAYHLRIPLVKSFRISVGEIKVKEFALFEMRSGDLTGWGEAAVDAVPFYTSETAGTALEIGRSVLAPLMRSQAWSSPADFAGATECWRGHSFTKGAFEQALWELFGKRENRSVAELLADGDPIREWVETGPSLGIRGEPEQLVAEVAAELEKGARRIKVKVMPGRDEAYLETVREAFPDICLMVDANAAYAPEELDRLATWDRFNLLMIEQPFAPDDLFYHAQLAERLETPVCLDESAESIHMVHCALEMKAADIINIKVGRVGGLTNTRHIHDLCRQAGIPVWIGSRIGTTVANSARVVAAALPGATLPTDAAFSSRYLGQDIVHNPMETRNAREIRVPTAAGFGFEIDREMIERFTIAKATI